MYFLQWLSYWERSVQFSVFFRRRVSFLVYGKCKFTFCCESYTNTRSFRILSQHFVIVVGWHFFCFIPLIFIFLNRLVGCFVVMIESPCCCMFVEHIHTLTEKVESKPLWVKAAIYAG